jgi:hypothetical protein
MLDDKNHILWDANKRYFCNNINNWNRLLEILKVNKNKPKPPSLRLIFYFCSKFALKYNINYLQKNRPFNVYDSYREMLKVHTKKRFDPFCRRTKKCLKLHNISINTNVAQLEFFRWIFDNRIHEYINKNYIDILINMKYDSKNKNKKHIYQKPLLIKMNNDLFINFE